MPHFSRGRKNKISWCWSFALKAYQAQADLMLVGDLSLQLLIFPGFSRRIENVPRIFLSVPCPADVDVIPTN